ncbi:MAG: hypothetical protein WD969_03660 [Paracoccaceae bacterium]
MSRPTVNDIARVTGGSLATVDRVMNARPGVRAKTMLTVKEAAARRGFVRVVAAANRARRRDCRAVFVLPDAGIQFLDTPHSREALLSAPIDAVITQNLGRVARSARSDGAPINHSQKQIRIEFVTRENLRPES